MKIKYEILTSSKKNFFLPENYPGSVKSTYAGYMKYNLLLQCSSSALGVLSTQQLLVALGAGSLTASAALNWIMKDGIGQLGGVIYAGTTGGRFDENPKFYKWVSAVSLNISCAIEMVTPLYPGHFLLLASIGTLGKNISVMSGSASRAAIHLHLCKENNLADLTAKSATQTTAACLGGTVIGTIAGYNSITYSAGLFYFLGFSLVHLFSCYKGLSYIELKTLNPQRLDILLKEYNKNKTILTPEEVSLKENILFPYKTSDLIIGSQKIFEKFVTGDGFIVAEDCGLVYLTYEEGASSSQMILGYVLARAKTLKTAFEELTIEKILEKGWDVERPFLSPNNTRFRVIKDNFHNIK